MRTLVLISALVSSALNANASQLVCAFGAQTPAPVGQRLVLQLGQKPSDVLEQAVGPYKVSVAVFQGSIVDARIQDTATGAQAIAGHSSQTQAPEIDLSLQEKDTDASMVCKIEIN